MSRKSIIVILIILSIGSVLGQKNTRIPNELINKVFCGEAEISGNNGYSSNTQFYHFPFRLTFSTEIIELSVQENGNWQVCQTFDKVMGYFEDRRINSPMYDRYVFDLSRSNQSSESLNREPVMKITSLSIKIICPDYIMPADAYEWQRNEVRRNRVELSVSDRYGLQKGMKGLLAEDICDIYITKKVREENEKVRKENEKRRIEAERQADLLLSNEIKVLLSKNKISDAYDKYKKMTINSEQLLQEINQKKAINENKVKKFLASNNIDSSIFYYKLNPPEKNIKLLIQDKLSELNKAEQEYVIDDKFVKFVKDSLLNKLTVLTSVDNILHINNKGNCTINDLAGNAKLKFQLPENLILRKKYDVFEYTLNTKSKFNFFIDTNKYFVKGLILDSWYETRIPQGTVAFYYAKKKKKEFILSNKVITKGTPAKIPTRTYDILTKMTYFRYEKMEEGSSWIPIINVPAFLNGIALGDMEASGALYNKCSLNFKNKLVEY
jgi:hypothetical protein